MAAGRDWLGVNAVLIDERQQRGMARRTVLGITDGLARCVSDRLDRRSGGHVPIGVRRADHLRADDAQRRAARIGADRRLDAAAAGQIHAARDHRLVRLRSPLRVEHLDVETAGLEDASAHAELGDGGVPLSALRHRHFQEFGRGRRAAGHGEHERESEGARSNSHQISPFVRRPAASIDGSKPICMETSSRCSRFIVGTDRVEHCATAHVGCNGSKTRCPRGFVDEMR